MKRISVGIAALSMLCLAGTAYARELKLSEIQKGDHFLVQSEQILAEQTAQLSNNQLHIQVHSSGELGDEQQGWKAVQAGKLDIARVGMSSVTDDIPIARLLSLPYLFQSETHMWNVVTSAKFGQQIEAQMRARGVLPLAYYSEGPRSFYTSKHPLRNSSDFKGLRLRSLDNPIYRDLISQLGATPVIIPFEKTAQALQDGKIDGAENSLDSYLSTGHSKYAKYYCMDEHFIVPDVLVISLKTWNSLTPGQQNNLREAAKKSMNYARKREAEIEAQLIDKARKEGVTILTHDQINTTSIEGNILKLYTKYVTRDQDLQTVMDILQTK